MILSDPAEGWEALAGWQRGVIGILVVLGVFGILLVVALVVAAE